MFALLLGAAGVWWLLEHRNAPRPSPAAADKGPWGNPAGDLLVGEGVVALSEGRSARWRVYQSHETGEFYAGYRIYGGDPHSHLEQQWLRQPVGKTWSPDEAKAYVLGELEQRYGVP